ncbi:MAG: 6-bladed beta-propeller, partial [Longimicrobiales bacterium]
QAFGSASHEFHRVAAAGVMPNGNIAVADAGDHLVKVFSAGGAFLFSVGGTGSGPGQIQAISSFVIDPDGGFAVYDRALNRLTYWTNDGQLEDISSIPSLPSGLFNSLSVLPGGGLIGVRLETPATSRNLGHAGLRWDDAVAVYIDRQLQARDTIAVFPGNERYYHPMDQHEYVRFTIPFFAARAVFDYRNDCVYAIVSRLVSVGEFCLEEKRQLSNVGPGLRRRFDWTGARLDLKRGDVIEHARAAVQRRTGLSLQPDEIAPRYPFDFPRERPPAGGLVVSEAGFIWLGDYFETDMSATSWMVFDPDGVLRVRYELPQVFRILSVGRKYLLALERDELDVERVVLYGLPENRTL